MDDTYKGVRPPSCPLCGCMMTSWEEICPICAEGLPEPERTRIKNLKPYPEFL